MRHFKRRWEWWFGFRQGERGNAWRQRKTFPCTARFNGVAEQLVRLNNDEFVAFTMQNGPPMLSNPVALIQWPDLLGDELPTRKAQAWATANTGKPKKEIQIDIERILRN